MGCHLRSGVRVSRQNWCQASTNSGQRDDVLIGAPYVDDESTSSGKLYLVYGSSLGSTGVVRLADADVAILGEDISRGYAGYSSTLAGDVDGDGLSDLLVAAPHSGGTGLLYLVYGASIGEADEIALSDADHVISCAAEEYNGFGYAIDSSGDMDGDGLSDIVVGSIYNDEDDFGQDFRAEWSASGRFADRSGRERPLGDLASKLLRVGAEAVNQTTERLKEAGEDFRPRDIVSGAAAISAKGREELAGLIAKEVRLYMDKFRIGEELRALMTDHSLEVHASVRLKPVPEEERAQFTGTDDSTPETEEAEATSD